MVPWYHDYSRLAVKQQWLPPGHLVVVAKSFTMDYRNVSGATCNLSTISVVAREDTFWGTAIALRGNNTGSLISLCS